MKTIWLLMIFDSMQKYAFDNLDRALAFLYDHAKLNLSAFHYQNVVHTVDVNAKLIEAYLDPDNNDIYAWLYEIPFCPDCHMNETEFQQRFTSGKFYE